MTFSAFNAKTSPRNTNTQYYQKDYRSSKNPLLNKKAENLYGFLKTLFKDPPDIFKEIKDLNLSNLRLVKIPSTIRFFTNLMNLPLNDNKIWKLLPKIRQLLNFKTFELNYHYIEMLPFLLKKF